MGNLHIFVEGFEVWRDVPGHERCYQVSDHGRVRSVDRLITEKTGRVKKSKGRVLCPSGSTSGHLSVVLGRAFGSKQIHAMVMSAFLGPYPLGMEILHLDHSSSNDRFSNLKYGTRSENIQIDYDAGRRCRAREVIALVANGGSQFFVSVSAAARALGVTPSCVGQACVHGWALCKCKTRVSYASV